MHYLQHKYRWHGQIFDLNVQKFNNSTEINYSQNIGFYYPMQQIIGAEGMEIVIASDYEKSQKNSSSLKQQPIFGPDFQVQNMQNPSEYLPQYQQNQHHERTFVQSCNTCCGVFCECWAYLFALTCCKCSCAYELPTSTAGIVQEFGKFNRMINPGLNIINPCTEEVRIIDMRINLLSTGAIYCITKDNVKVTIMSSIAYRIVNPIQVYYVLGNRLSSALVQATHSSIRNVIGETVLDEALSQRLKLVENSKTLVLRTVPQGVIIENVFIEDIIVPPQTMNALSSAARQRRTSQANIINSKADVQSASLLKQAADLLDTKAAMQIRYLEMVTELGKRGSKLIMPIGVDKKGFKQ